MSGRECRRIRVTLRAEGLTPRPREETAALSAHLAGCAGCRAYAAQERAARAALAATYGRVDPLPLARGWRAALPGRRARGRGWGAFGAALNGALAVALVAIVALVGGLALRGMGAGPRGLSPATPTIAAVACAPTTASAAPTPTFGSGIAQMTAVAIAARATQLPAAGGDPCSPPAAGLLTLEAAAARMRTFLGQPQAHFFAWYDAVLPVYGEGMPLKYIVKLRRVASDGTLALDTLYIDARTGLVGHATFPARAKEPPLAQPLMEEAARARAEAYARTRFPQFATLTFTGVTTQLGGPQFDVNEDLFVVTWAQRTTDSGAMLPVTVRVVISPQNGQVLDYIANQQIYVGPTVPEIARGEAEVIARDAMRAKSGRDMTPTDVTLDCKMPYSINAEQTGPVLVWSVRFLGYPPVYIDALTGAVIVAGPLG